MAVGVLVVQVFGVCLGMHKRWQRLDGVGAVAGEDEARLAGLGIDRQQVTHSRPSLHTGVVALNQVDTITLIDHGGIDHPVVR